MSKVRLWRTVVKGRLARTGCHGQGVMGRACKPVSYCQPIPLQMQLMFVDECEKYKDLIHVHSFAHDFHLRCINDYLRGNTSLLHPHFHLSNFLSEFLQIYSIPPSFARNCLAQGECYRYPSSSCCRG